MLTPLVSEYLLTAFRFARAVVQYTLYVCGIYKNPELNRTFNETIAYKWAITYRLLISGVKDYIMKIQMTDQRLMRWALRKSTPFDYLWESFVVWLNFSVYKCPYIIFVYLIRLVNLLSLTPPEVSFELTNNTIIRKILKLD